MLLRFLLFTLCLVLSTELWSQSLTSTVDRNRLAANQTLKLSISYDGSTRTDALDLSAIQQDFEVVSTASGSSYQLSNNQTTRVTTWELVLLPKRSGKLVIPSFSLGNIFSEAIEVEVAESGQIADTDDPMIVELSLDRNQIVVGEQVLVSIRLRAKSHLADLAGEELKLDGADIQLVDQKDYSEVQNGVSWRVIEWSYALFAQNAGSLAIPKQLFTATIPSTQRRSFFDSFAMRGQRIARRSDAAAITVNPAPADSDNWFPASMVNISATWSADPSELRVGEPLTRTIEITAESQLAAAIPPLTPATQINYKEYQDQPALENRQSTNGITGVRRESSAIVPSQEGTIEFPAQVIRWWDINANQWREASLPAESYQVLPAVQNQSFSPPQNFESAPVFNLDGGEPSLAPAPTQTAEQPLWRWATIALVVVVILQFILLMRPRTVAPVPVAKTSATSNTEKQAWNRLEAALKSGNVATIRSCILGWSQARWPNEPLHTLDRIAARSKSAELKQALSELDKILFSGVEAQPATEILLSELKKLRDLKAEAGTKSALAPLYPQPL